VRDRHHFAMIEPRARQCRSLWFAVSGRKPAAAAWMVNNPRLFALLDQRVFIAFPVELDGSPRPFPSADRSHGAIGTGALRMIHSRVL